MLVTHSLSLLYYSQLILRTLSFGPSFGTFPPQEVSVTTFLDADARISEGDSEGVIP